MILRYELLSHFQKITCRLSQILAYLVNSYRKCLASLAPILVSLV